MGINHLLSDTTIIIVLLSYTTCGLRKMARRLAELKQKVKESSGAGRETQAARDPNAMRAAAEKKKLLAGIMAETERIGKVAAEIEKFTVLGKPITDDLVRTIS
jgi:hypothetical protein